MLIAITGGIGSGKSVVSQLLRVLGYTVYDCDARAKWVMTHDPLLRQQLIELFGPDTYMAPKGEFKSKEKFEGITPQTSQTLQTTQTLNKSYLSSRIFSDPKALAQMNACVHPAVQRDLQRQYEASTPQNLITSKPQDLFFFESAILFESGFDQLSHPDQVWTVSAPLELRIARAMQRDHTAREQVLARIHSQLPQEEKERRSDCIIYNDDTHSLIDQVSLTLTRTERR